MKLKLIFLAIFHISLNLFPQVAEPIKQQKELVADLPIYNFFYLSKYLDNINLKAEQRNAVYGQFFNLLGAQKLEELSLSPDSRLLKLKEILNQAIANSPARYTFTSYLKANDIAGFQAKYQLKPEDSIRLKEIEGIINEITALDKKKLKNIQFSNDSQKEILKKISIITADTASTITKQEVETLQKNLSKNTKDAEDANSKIEKEKREKTNLLIDKIDKFSSDYLAKHLEVAFASATIKEAQNFYSGTEVAKTLQYTNNYVQSVQSQGSSGFQLPSQAQIIDAMALFLANRSKQEAAIWFMDQVRARLQNPLIKAAFPETIKLISSLEDYKIPNFGTEWRYAISTDFIKMPENIADSEWIKLTIGKNTNLNTLKSSIKLGYKINQLMAGDFNYRDIIESLYLDELKTKKDSAYNFDNNIKNSVTLLYAINKELYSIDYSQDKPAFRLLNYEDLNSLDQEQWKILTSLIYLKYFYSREAADKTNDFFNNNQDSPSVKIAISQLLVNLSQFEKIRNDLAAASDTEKLDFSKQNFYSTWKIIEQTLDNLGEICFGDIAKCKANKSNIDTINGNLKTTLKIYESLQSHNFNGVIQNTLKLIGQFQRTDNTVPGIGSLNIQHINNDYFIKKDNKKLKITKVKEQITISIDSSKQKIVIDNYTEFKRLWDITGFNKYDAKELMKISKINKNNYNKILRKFDFKTADFITILDSVNNNKLYHHTQTNSTATADISAYINKLDARYRDQLIKLTSFLGDVMTATTSEQMADVISSHALPPTSYKLKRKVNFSIDFNAYVGAYGAYNFPSSASTFDKGLTGGITAPIGLTFTWKIGNNNWGISANFVDLGNIVNHYLTSSERYYKDVHFSEVFAPNANILYSIPKTPLVAFLGASFIALKSTTVDGIAKNGSAFDLTLIQAGIKIDIPLINLHKSQ